MKVKFERDHVSNKAGDVAELEDGLGKYLVAVGAAKEVKSRAKTEEPKTDEGVKANAEILADVVDSESKQALVKDAEKAGIDIKEEKATRKTKEEKVTKKTK